LSLSSKESALAFQAERRQLRAHIAELEMESAMLRNQLAAHQEEQQRSEEQCKLLIGEMNHRVKNILALVLAVTERTWRVTVKAGLPIEQFREDFLGRLRAMGRVHDLLLREAWRKAMLADVVRNTLVLHAGVPGGKADGVPRIEVDGPPVYLQANVAVMLAMVFHELATNAAKHGALSVPGGQVAVRWKQAAEGALLEIAWAESGGPKVVKPPGRRGFGLDLLERGVARQLNCEVKLDFAPEGVRCRLCLPLSDSVKMEHLEGEELRLGAGGSG